MPGPGSDRVVLEVESRAQGGRAARRIVVWIVVVMGSPRPGPGRDPDSAGPVAAEAAQAPRIPLPKPRQAGRACGEDDACAVPPAGFRSRTSARCKLVENELAWQPPADGDCSMQHRFANVREGTAPLSLPRPSK